MKALLMALVFTSAMVVHANDTKVAQGAPPPAEPTAGAPAPEAPKADKKEAKAEKKKGKKKNHK